MAVSRCLYNDFNAPLKFFSHKHLMNPTKHSVHLVLRARLPVKVYNNSLNSNHIHLLVKARTQKSLHDFLRVLNGQIAQRITGAVRGRKNKISFWLRPAWKRMVNGGRDFFNLHRYIYQNQLETLGLIPYQRRKRKPPPGLKTLS